MKKENGRDRFIQPIRYIPFDIGAPLPEAKLKQISESLERKFQRMSPNGFFGVVGNGVSLAFCLTEQIRLYLFRYGIGVFSVTDEAYWFNERDGAFAIEYCQQRKYRHKQILNFQAEYSELLQNTIGLIRTIAHSPGKPCRITASEAWEYRGLSYVMTVSCLHLEQKGFEWEQLEETVKKNLLVMLTPSLMNMEDSLRSDYKSGECQSIETLQLANYNAPANYSHVADYGLYVSWAAVIPVLGQEEISVMELLEALEVDLQAMWMYIYCMQQDFIVKKHIPYGLAESICFNAQREFVRFRSLADTSIPEYIRKIRSALIETSGIQDLMDSFLDDLQYTVQKNKVLRDIRLERIEYLKIAVLVSMLGMSTANQIWKRLKG